MLRLLKRFAWTGVLALSLLLTTAFSYLGPNNEAYQIPELGYNPNADLGDVAPTGPKDIGEEYRRNMPVLYYACDQNFLDYFGSNGLAAIDAAAAVFNNLARTNLSHYSADLSEFPLESSAENYRASALGLTDLKSTTMGILIEQLGLANPERYVWTLHSRWRFPGNPPPCPEGMGYYVIKRNFENLPSALDQFQNSSYVNGTLFSYSVLEYCDAANSPAAPMLADAAEIPVDPLEIGNTPIAAASPALRQVPVFGQLLLNLESSLFPGQFFNNLTRDDVAGLRSLMRTNNHNVESTGPDTFVAATNVNSFQLLFTSNLAQLVSQSLTNTAGALQALYPGLVVSSTTPIFTNVVSSNVFFYFTNYPWSPPNQPALAFATNVSTNVTIWFSHTVDNIRVGPYYTNGPISLLAGPWPYTNGFVTILETSTGPRPWGAPGQIFTNFTARTMATNFVNGEYFILPANSDCGVRIVSTQLVSVINQTNLAVVATNFAGATNIAGTSFAQELVLHFTNSVFVINPVPCLTGSNVVALRQGIERVRFVRRDFDSLLGRFFEPITNVYTVVAVTNSQLQPQTVIRQVTLPDILFTAQDMTTVNAVGGPYNEFARTVPFNTANAQPGLAGPGTLEPITTVTFNKLGPFYFNSQSTRQASFLDELTATTELIWASYDATTNAPVVYPNGTSLLNLENQVFISVSPATLPDGAVGTPYGASFSATGGTPPYTWSLTPGTPGLPPGLSLSPGGMLTGTPTEMGTYDIVVRLTEGGLRTVDRRYEIKINP